MIWCWNLIWLVLALLKSPSWRSDFLAAIASNGALEAKLVSLTALLVWISCYGKHLSVLIVICCNLFAGSWSCGLLLARASRADNLATTNGALGRRHIEYRLNVYLIIRFRCTLRSGRYRFIDIWFFYNHSCTINWSFGCLATGSGSCSLSIWVSCRWPSWCWSWTCSRSRFLNYFNIFEYKLGIVH